MKGHLEIIECPECCCKQIAFVEHLIPFNGYFHECELCGHTILESEWNTKVKFKYQDDVVPYYANKIAKAHPQTPNGYDQRYFERLNKIILKKYTPNGLLRIKEDAWRFFNSIKMINNGRM